MQGQLNRSPPLLRRAGRHEQARCWFDSRHEPPGWRQALPCADRIQLVERGADPATGKLPRLGFGHRGRDPGLAASGRGSVYVPAARKAPASFSPWRARFWRRQRARSVTSCLWTAARIDARVCRGSGFNLWDVFPTGCVEGRAERAARPPGRGLRRRAELDHSRPQPVVDGVECFDQLVIPWLAPIE